MNSMKENLKKKRNKEMEYYMEENLNLLIIKEIGKMINNVKKKMNKKNNFKIYYKKQESQRKKEKY